VGAIDDAPSAPACIDRASRRGSAAADIPQLHLTNAAGERRMRLLGFERVELRRGETRQVTAPPRLLVLVTLKVAVIVSPPLTFRSL
jgi:hypothetical protein